MNAKRRESIVRAFSLARDYENHATVQQQVAQGLAHRIALLDLPIAPRILEIGCGTGFLTQAMGRMTGEKRFVTDLSPIMVERCRRRLGEHPGWRFASLDGEYGTPDGDKSLDLICSSMTMQWFDNLPVAVSRMIDWLAPGGWLAFTTLTANTFGEWRAAHDAEGVRPGTPPLCQIEDLVAIEPGLQAVPHRFDRYVESFPSARDFLLSLKAIGATTASQEHRPLSPSIIRRVMRRFENNGCRSTYEVATCLYRKPA